MQNSINLQSIFRSYKNAVIVTHVTLVHYVLPSIGFYLLG